MKGFNKEETIKLRDAIIEAVGRGNVISVNQESEILWHIKVENECAGMKLRDDEGNLWELNDHPVTISFVADVNPHGVGDGKSPEIALTYSIGAEIRGSRKGFRKQIWSDDCDIAKFYDYGREIGTMPQELAHWLAVSFGKINRLK